MKSNSKKHGGFSLIEIVISMAVITIISVAVYDGYMLMIKGTKQGEVKQTSTLIGNEISEQIKAVSENKIFESLPDGSNIKLTDKIQLQKEEKDGKVIYTSLPLYLDEDGLLVTDNYRYRLNVRLQPKKTNNGDKVSIEEVLSEPDNTEVQNRNISIIKEKNENAKIVNKNKVETVNSLNIDEDKTIKINVNNSNTNQIQIDGDDLRDLDYDDVNTDKKQQITMDLKYCTGKIKIEVTNSTKIPLNLFVLNSSDAEIINKKGILHEYRRSEVGSKIGTLYEVNIEIFDDKSVDGFKDKPIFKTNFAQNINIK